MKKSLILAATGLLLAGCGTLEQQQVVLNREVKTSDGGRVLLGQQTPEQFLKAPYKSWYDEEHDSYTPNTTIVAQLQKLHLKSYPITIFVGTWCEDTHREYPRFIKILEDTGYPIQRLRIIATNERYESPDGEEVLNHLTNVPTFIVYKGKREIGRIVEYPESGYLEEDLLQILQAANPVKTKAAKPLKLKQQKAKRKK